MTRTLLLSLFAASLAACATLGEALDAPTGFRPYKSLPKSQADLQDLQHRDSGVAFGLPASTWPTWRLP